jgi:hypothetical protein
MPSAPGTVRENVQAQGFCGLGDSTCGQINYPLRLSPAICMAPTPLRSGACAIDPPGLKGRHGAS